MLDLKDARYFWHDGYRILEVEVDGRPIRLTTEWKPTLREAGLVYVDDDLGLPDRTIKTPDGGATVTVGGCTDDRRLVELFRRFWQGEDFAPGPVAIPD